ARAWSRAMAPAGAGRSPDPCSRGRRCTRSPARAGASTPPPTPHTGADHSSQKSLLAKLSEELGREEHFLEAAGNCRCTRMRVSSAADITTEVCDPADDLLQRQVTVGN